VVVSKKNVGKSVLWVVRNMGGRKDVSGRILAFVPAGERIRPLARETGRLDKSIADVSAVDRYLVSVPQERPGRRPRLYAPRAATIDSALHAAPPEAPRGGA
jgi:hypothetical protein